MISDLTSSVFYSGCLPELFAIKKGTSTSTSLDLYKQFSISFVDDTVIIELNAYQDYNYDLETSYVVGIASRYSGAIPSNTSYTITDSEVTIYISVKCVDV